MELYHISLLCYLQKRFFFPYFRYESFLYISKWENLNEFALVGCKWMEKKKMENIQQLRNTVVRYIAKIKEINTKICNFCGRTMWFTLHCKYMLMVCVIMRICNVAVVWHLPTPCQYASHCDIWFDYYFKMFGIGGRRWRFSHKSTLIAMPKRENRLPLVPRKQYGTRCWTEHYHQRK